MSRKYSFDTVSTVTMSRSRLNMGRRVKTSMRVGDLVPIDIREVLPGDNWTCHEGHLVRLSTAYLRPVMDTAFMDVYSFFVPLRLLYEDYEEVFGNASPNGYVQEELGHFPRFSDEGLNYLNIASKSVGDYLGLPVGYCLPDISVLPFRAFALVYEEWFRNENTVSPMLVQKGELSTTEYPNNNAWRPDNYTGKLPKVGKKNDYFTSCLPAPQKGAPVEFGIAGTAPVNVTGSFNYPVFMVNNDGLHRKIFTPDLIDPLNNLVKGKTLGVSDTGFLSQDLESTFPASGHTSAAASMSLVAAPNASLQSVRSSGTVDLSNISAVNVNDLRFAFQLQKMLEKDARGGGRYREYLLTHYGVHNADARMQIPEFLGGKRTPLNLQQVAQTSKGDSDSPLASLAGYSQTLGRSGYRKAFTEHGYILTVACIRYEHSYQQGIDRSWFRYKREDFYDPLFANIGEQPVYTSQLYGFFNSQPDGLKSVRDRVFGYQEAWAEYRYAPDIITGEMRSSAQNSFDVYHFADNYENAPVLNEQFTNENPTFFRRTTAIGEDADVDDFLVDFYFDTYAYRVMPVRSIPGLVDHH